MDACLTAITAPVTTTQPLFLGVNLLSREGYSQAGDRMRTVSQETIKIILVLILLTAWKLLSAVIVHTITGYHVVLPLITFRRFLVTKDGMGTLLAVEAVVNR